MFHFIYFCFIFVSHFIMFQNDAPQLPSTVIVFITQEDIFKMDQAKYTFTEQCEEVAGLHLEDGTKKIFLNMTSTNGSQELVSLLQYMKETKIDNPNITVQDSRILELDQIVTEVKESEEWEAAKMNILEVGIEQGIKRGGYLKLISQIQKKHAKGYSISEIADMLEEPAKAIAPVCQLLSEKQYATAEEILRALENLPPSCAEDK